MKLLKLAAACLLALSTLSVSADPEKPSKKKKEKAPVEDTTVFSDQDLKLINIVTSLKYQNGTIPLSNGLATIKLPTGFKFLDAEQSQKVIYDLWGNPRSNNPDTKLLGMIFPENGGPVGDSSWAFVVQYENVGYVKDDDAAEIDYTQMKKDIQSSEEEENKLRIAAGSFGMHFVDWAEKPYYDKNTKVLYWAKNFRVDGFEKNTLNYDIRVLGRKGIMSLQAVADLDLLPEVNKYKNQVLGMVEFGAGNKYSDFNSSTDKVAAWTIGGLVAGKVLAKIGFFAIILKYLKIILLVVGGGIAAIWRFVTGRKKKKEEELKYQSTTGSV